MPNILKLTFAPLLSLITVMLGISYLNTFISLQMTSAGYSSLITGILYASYYTGMMLGAMYLERMIHKKGHIRSFSIFAASTAVTVTIQSFTSPGISWIAFRFVTGAACAGLFIVIESWLLLLSSEKNRGSLLAIYMIGLYSAQCIGQFGILAVPMDSVLSFNLAIVFCSLSLIPVCLMRASAPTLADSEYVSLFYIFKKTPLAFMGCFTSGLVLGAIYALAPVYAKTIGLSIFKISLFLATLTFGGMFLQWPLGKLSDIFKRRNIIILISFSLFVISALLAIKQDLNFTYLLILLFFFGGGSFTLYPVSITYCCDFFSSAGITSITAAALIIFGCGSILGPLICPFFMMFLGPSGLFIYFAITSLLLGIFAIWRTHKTPLQPEKTKEKYKVHPSATGKFNDTD